MEHHGYVHDLSEYNEINIISVIMALTSCPVHHLSSTLIRPEEQQLGFTVQINDGLFDPRSLSRDKQINNGLNTFNNQPTFSSISRNKLTSTYFWKHISGDAPKLGRIVPFAPLSGISLFFNVCVEASA